MATEIVLETGKVRRPDNQVQLIEPDAQASWIERTPL